AASLPDQDDLDSLRARIVAREGPGAEKKYLHFKPLWQRALIVAAGPVANFLLAIALLAVFFMAFGEPVTPTKIGAVERGTAAERAGLKVGDRILAYDGRRLTNFEDLRFYIRFRSGVPIRLTLDRAGQTLDIVATPGVATEKSPFGGTETKGLLGVAPARGYEIVRYNPIQAVGVGAAKTWELAESTGFFLGRLVTGQVDVTQLHSFVGIAHASGSISKEAVAAAEVAKINPLVALSFMLLQIAASLSVSVGILNLLPIPVLDGGHLLFYAYESVVRRPVSARIQATGYRVGLALLLCLMLFATWNDLSRLRVFHFFGGLFS
ncbi:MAG TPA: RIP metalloprotease RseP, partial [Caulobacteraceae bacterium]|nr:RIP metalloprotease RseP [Caulobacteraceae bacterium]